MSYDHVLWPSNLRVHVEYFYIFVGYPLEYLQYGKRIQIIGSFGEEGFDILVEFDGLFELLLELAGKFSLLGCGSFVALVDYLEDSHFLYDCYFDLGYIAKREGESVI